VKTTNQTGNHPKMSSNVFEEILTLINYIFSKPLQLSNEKSSIVFRGIQTLINYIFSTPLQLSNEKQPVFMQQETSSNVACNQVVVIITT
jgi:hypothetical protein